MKIWYNSELLRWLLKNKDYKIDSKMGIGMGAFFLKNQNANNTNAYKFHLYPISYPHAHPWDKHHYQYDVDLFRHFSENIKTKIWIYM